MYKLNEFMSDVAPVLNFKILRALSDAGYQNTDGDDYVKNGPQFTRNCLKRASEEADQLIKAGLPDTAFVQDIFEFLTRRFDVKNIDAPEIMNRENVLACVNSILAHARA